MCGQLQRHEMDKQDFQHILRQTKSQQKNGLQSSARTAKNAAGESLSGLDSQKRCSASLRHNNTVTSSAPQISRTVLESNSAPWSRVKHSESRTQEFHSEIFYTIPNAQKGYKHGSSRPDVLIAFIPPHLLCYSISMHENKFFSGPLRRNCAHSVLYLSTDISSGSLTRTKVSKAKRLAPKQCWCLIYLILFFHSCPLKQLFS